MAVRLPTPNCRGEGKELAAMPFCPPAAGGHQSHPASLFRCYSLLSRPPPVPTDDPGEYPHPSSGLSRSGPSQQQLSLLASLPAFSPEVYLPNLYVAGFTNTEKRQDP